MKRKKPKKRGREQRKPAATFPAAYGVGDRVRVRPGTTDPDFPDVPLGGWAGTVVDVDPRSNPPTYLVEWDRYTRDRMHPVYRTRCERDGLEPDRLWLGEADLEVDDGRPVVIESPTHLVARPLSAADPDDRVRAVFGLTSDDPLPPVTRDTLRHYAAYLTARLSFPFRATDTVATGPRELTEHVIQVVRLLGVEDGDDEDGLLCEANAGGEVVVVPLADLDVRHDRRDRRLIEDYAYWFGAGSVEVFVTDFDGRPGLFDPDADPPSPGQAVRAFAQCGLAAVGYGGVLGALAGAVDGTPAGAAVGAGVVGLLGLAVGVLFGPAFASANRMRFGSVTGAVAGTVGGAVLGAGLGAAVVAFPGTLAGGLAAALLGRWPAGRVRPFGGAVLGAGVGAVALACYRDPDAALLGAAHGAWVGAAAAVLLLVATFGWVAVCMRFQPR